MAEWSNAPGLRKLLVKALPKDTLRVTWFASASGGSNPSSRVQQLVRSEKPIDFYSSFASILV